MTIAEMTIVVDTNKERMWYFRKRTKRKILLLFRIVGILSIAYICISVFKNLHEEEKSPLEIINISPTSGGQNTYRGLFIKKSRNRKRRECPIPKLKHEKSVTTSERSSCHRVPPVPDSCDVAGELFSYSPNQCSKESLTDLCFIKDGVKVECRTGGCSSLQLGVRSVQTGELEWRDSRSVDQLQVHITQLLKSPNTGYCYIKCEQELPIESQHQHYMNYDFANQISEFDHVQLLLLPPNIKTKKWSNQKRLKDFVNINLIFIDSTSRHHFYRSLPKTIELFNELNSDSNVSVLDFQHLQAIRSRTFETLNSLLGGFVPDTEKTFGTLEMPPEALRIEGLFGPYEDAGYSTLWLEDLCFEWEWGISKDLCVHNKSLTVEETWRNLNKAFRKARIGSFGMSTANCEILANNGLNDHFHGPDNGAVCFNGRHQHEYHLEYLKLYQEVMMKSKQPFLTFLETNVGHEDTGRRIQTFDAHLVEYLKFAIQNDNMLTIIFSDHGNTYGKFLERSSEARVEIYHPSLFMIIPEELSKTFGEDKMSALILNQHRLVSHLDLHYTLKSFVTDSKISEIHKQFKVTKKGLFEPIVNSRQCSEVPQIPPNFCICEGGESRMTNSSLFAVYAHYAVGSINNVIQKQFRKSHKESLTGFGNCHRLELVSFQHIRRSINLDKSKTLTMDLMFNTGDSSYKHYEVFLVSIKAERSGRLSLIQFDRLSPYRKYDVCIDKGVDLDMCVCNISNKSMNKRPALTDLPLSDSTITKSALLMKGSSSVIENSENCLLQINQQSKEGLTLSLMNVCTDKDIHVTITVRADNLNLSDKNVQQCDLNPGDIRFLLAGLVTDDQSTWSMEFSVDVTMTKRP